MQLDVEVAGIEGVLLDEFSARFHLIAHQQPEHFVGGPSVGEVDFQQGSIGWIERRFAQLLGIHFAEPFEPRDLEALLTSGPNLRQQSAKIFKRPSHVFAADQFESRRRISRSIGGNQIIDAETERR